MAETDDTPSPAYLALKASMDAWEMWDALMPEQRLQLILDRFPVEAWFYADPHGEDNLSTLAHFWADMAQRGRIKARFKAIGGNTWDLDKAVEAYTERRNGTGPAMLQLPEVAPPLMPALPREAQMDASRAAGAAPWLEAYCEFSRRWAPRSAEGFHEAVGLWVLATVAARRICVEFGDPIYPVLFLNLAAESTIYTKSTAVAQGETILRRAGLTFLLTPDHSTPQALIRNMGGRVPVEYAKASEEEQEQLRQRLAFSGQRGWYYAEWGGMLQQMHRTDSPMALFHELIRRLDDDKGSFSSETIQRGLDYIDAPYLSLLTSSTPHDLAPFMKPQDKWWHDGFWPRFAFIVPEGPPVITRRPQGRGVPPSALIAELHTWHTSLGLPTVTVDEVKDRHDRPTGEYHIVRSTFPEQVFSVDADAEEAYATYGEAMWTIDILNKDLRPSYARLPHKALRIALLFASMQGARSVTLAHWAYAQRITEHWRAMLHHIVNTISETAPMSRDVQLEERMEGILAQEGPQKLRTLCRRLHIESAMLKRLIQSMEYTGRVQTKKEGRSMYAFLPNEMDGETETQEGEQSEVPF